MKKSIVLCAVLGVGWLAVYWLTTRIRPKWPTPSAPTAVKKTPIQVITQGSLSPETQAELAARQREKYAYRGTQIQTTAIGEKLTLHTKIAGAFAKQDPQPPERRQLFAWCLQHPGVVLTGWSGNIQEVTKSTSGWLVKVRLAPRIAGIGAVSFTPDYCIETWVYNDGDLRFVSTVRPPDAKQILFGD